MLLGGNESLLGQIILIFLNPALAQAQNDDQVVGLERHLEDVAHALDGGFADNAVVAVVPGDNAAGAIVVGVDVVFELGVLPAQELLEAHVLHLLGDHVLGQGPQVLAVRQVVDGGANRGQLLGFLVNF